MGIEQKGVYIQSQKQKKNQIVWRFK